MMQLTREALAEASPELRRSAVTLHRALTDFVRHYQFRNRNEICCYGITVSQCYLLDGLSAHGPLSMQELARHLCLKISTVTRLVDGLVKKSLVRRQKDAEDRRIVRVELTETGRKTHEKITEDLLVRQEEVLLSMPEAVREEVVRAICTLVQKTSPSGRSCCA
jgi:MarR family transcriptional regulator, 2-MHQ and catechol-resistance regulon repressor